MHVVAQRHLGLHPLRQHRPRKRRDGRGGVVERGLEQRREARGRHVDVRGAGQRREAGVTDAGDELGGIGMALLVAAAQPRARWPYHGAQAATRGAGRDGAVRPAVLGATPKTPGCNEVLPGAVDPAFRRST